MNLEDIFYNLASEVRKITLINTSTSPDFTNIKMLLKKFEKAINNYQGINEFTDIHYSELKRLSLTFMQQPFSSDNTIISFNDRIFKNTLGISRKSPSFITKLFENFIKGITYFQDQIELEKCTPVYHRLYYCGNGDDAFRQMYNQCEPLMQPDRRLDVKKRIERCYIERLIYDELYSHLTLHFPTNDTDEPGQDIGHKHRIEIVKNDFKSCFPNLDIIIDIEYDMNIPIKITITRNLRGQFSSSETYRKTLIIDTIMGGKSYLEDIEAERKTSQYTYTRIQSFTNKPMWLRL